VEIGFHALLGLVMNGQGHPYLFHYSLYKNIVKCWSSKLIRKSILEKALVNIKQTFVRKFTV
jgi:hypothetical protein